MDTNSRFKINVPKIVHETIDGEAVILNLDKGNYYSLDGIGVEIWGFIENNANLGSITERIRNNYHGDQGGIEVTINKFVSELIEEDLVVLDNENITENDESPHGQVQTGLKETKPDFEAPKLNKYTDMQDLLLLDPIHDVDETEGWPTRQPESQTEKL